MRVILGIKNTCILRKISRPVVFCQGGAVNSVAVGTALLTIITYVIKAYDVTPVPLKLKVFLVFHLCQYLPVCRRPHRSYSSVPSGKL